MGDFNADLMKFTQIQSQLQTVPWKFSLLKSLTNQNFIETYAQFHDQNVPTWSSNDKAACLDHIWISQNLTTDLLYADTLPPLIYGTDHKIVSAHFITSGIFSLPSLFTNRRNCTNIMNRYIYSNMNDIFPQQTRNGFCDDETTLKPLTQLTNNLSEKLSNARQHARQSNQH